MKALLCYCFKSQISFSLNLSFLQSIASSIDNLQIFSDSSTFVIICTVRSVLTERNAMFVAASPNFEVNIVGKQKFMVLIN